MGKLKTYWVLDATDVISVPEASPEGSLGMLTVESDVASPGLEHAGDVD